MSKACDSHESSGFSAALMPPAAALECDRTGWTLLMIATVAPARGRRERGTLTGEPGADDEDVVCWHGWKPICRRVLPDGRASGRRVGRGMDAPLRPRHGRRRPRRRRGFLIGILLDEHEDLEVVAEADGATLRSERRWPHARRTSRSWTPACRAVDGFELTRALLERRPDLRVAILTSVVDDVVERRRPRERGRRARVLRRQRRPRPCRPRRRRSPRAEPSAVGSASAHGRRRRRLAARGRPARR